MVHPLTIPRDPRPRSGSLRVHGAVAFPQEFQRSDPFSLPEAEEVADAQWVASWNKLRTRWEGVVFSGVDR